MAGLTVAGCSGTPDREPPEPGTSTVPRQTPSTGAPVPDPGPRDRVLPGPPLEPTAWRQPVERPNLLMMTADDATRSDMRYLPHVRRLLARQGVTFANGLAPTPICVPARASLLTGQYADNHGAETIGGDNGGFTSFEDDDTLPVWLRDAGYDTMFIGKYLNGYGERGTSTYVPPGWTDWQGSIDPTTYNFVAPSINDNGTVRKYDEYSTDLFADLTEDALTDPARQRRPWYLWVNYVAPHTGGPAEDDDPRVVYPDDPTPVPTTYPAPRHRDLFADLDLPDKPDMFEAETSDKFIIRAVQERWSGQRKAQLRESRQQRIEALQAVDEAVARTIRTLRRTGQLDDTYVVFTSDNGYVQGEHNLGGKLWYFREIIGIPMYLRGPGVPRGERVRTPVTNPDWATTFAALAGAEPTRPQDGVDIMPWLSSGATTRVVPIEAWPVRGGERPVYTGVWAGRWTWVRGANRRVEFYDKRADPWQLSSLTGDDRFRRQQRQLGRLADAAVGCAGSTCPREFYR